MLLPGYVYVCRDGFLDLSWVSGLGRGGRFDGEASARGWLLEMVGVANRNECVCVTVSGAGGQVGAT